MATHHLVRSNGDLGVPGKPVAYIYGLPLDAAETLAWMDLEAGMSTPDQRALLRAWKVKMVLLKGTWVEERLASVQI